MMKQAPDMDIPTGSHNVIPEFVEQSFLQATYYLNSRRAGYLWEWITRPEVCTISSWYKHVQRSNTEKFGNDNDSANFPPPDQHKVLDQRRRVCQRHNSPRN